MRDRIFHALHQVAGEPLVLPNAWDAGSARMLEHAGAKAIATTSAGVAWAHGYSDGDLLPNELLLTTLRSTVRAVTVPVSADIEGGYSNDPAAVAELVSRVLDAGVVGINIEDGDHPVELLAAKIEAIRGKSSTLFVNARTDVYLFQLVEPERRLEETLRRAAIYKAAGASGIFVPAILNPAEIKTVVAEVGLPVNVLALPGVPPLADLAGLGVARLSAGSGISREVFRLTASLGTRFLSTGTLGEEAASEWTYASINNLMPIC